MKAVIVAAGISSRLYPLSKHAPKCLLEVGGKSILKSQVLALNSRGIDEIGVVVGYKRKKIIQAFKDKLTYIFNPFYESTNDMASLWFAKDFVKGDPFVYLHSDLIFDPGILDICLQSKGPIVMIYDPTELNKESMKLELDRNNYLLRSSKDILLSQAAGEWIGMIKFDKVGCKKIFLEIEKGLENKNFNAFDTLALTNLAKKGEKIIAVATSGLPWVEIDFEHDLEKARRIF